MRRPELKASGVITLIQEDRFRLETGQGNGLLFTLARRVNLTAEDVERFVAQGTRVRVSYRGQPDIDALATRIEPLTRRSGPG